MTYARKLPTVSLARGFEWLGTLIPDHIESCLLAGKWDARALGSGQGFQGILLEIGAIQPQRRYLMRPLQYRLMYKAIDWGNIFLWVGESQETQLMKNIFLWLMSH